MDEEAALASQKPSCRFLLPKRVGNAISLLLVTSQLGLSLGVLLALSQTHGPAPAMPDSCKVPGYTTTPYYQHCIPAKPLQVSNVHLHLILAHCLMTTLLLRAMSFGAFFTTRASWVHDRVMPRLDCLLLILWVPFTLSGTIAASFRMMQAGLDPRNYYVNELGPQVHVLFYAVGIGVNHHFISALFYLHAGQNPTGQGQESRRPYGATALLTNGVKTDDRFQHTLVWLSTVHTVLALGGVCIFGAMLQWVLDDAHEWVFHFKRNESPGTFESIDEGIYPYLYMSTGLYLAYLLLGRLPELTVSKEVYSRLHLELEHGAFWIFTTAYLNRAEKDAYGSIWKLLGLGLFAAYASLYATAWKYWLKDLA